MSKQASRTPSKEQIEAWQIELEAMERLEAESTKRGQKDTYWHTRAEAIRATLAALEKKGA